MRFIITFLAFLLLLSGCSAPVELSKPLVTDEAVEIDPGILGKWYVVSNGDLYLYNVIKNSEGNLLDIFVSSDGEKFSPNRVKGIAKPFRLGGRLYFNYQWVFNNGLDSTEESVLSGYIVLGVEPNIQNNLQIHFMREGVIEQLIDAGRIKGEILKGTNQKGEKRLIEAHHFLVSDLSAEDFSNLITEIGYEKLFATNSPLTLRRLETPAKLSTTQGKSDYIEISEEKIKTLVDAYKAELATQKQYSEVFECKSRSSLWSAPWKPNGAYRIYLFRKVAFILSMTHLDEQASSVISKIDDVIATMDEYDQKDYECNVEIIAVKSFVKKIDDLESYLENGICKKSKTSSKKIFEKLTFSYLYADQKKEMMNLIQSFIHEDDKFDDNLYENIARAQIKKGDYLEAVSSIKKITNDGEKVGIFLELALAQASRGDRKAARQAALKAANAANHLPYHLYNVALVQLFLEDKEGFSKSMSMMGKNKLSISYLNTFPDYPWVSPETVISFTRALLPHIEKLSISWEKMQHFESMAMKLLEVGQKELAQEMAKKAFLVLSQLPPFDPQKGDCHLFNDSVH